ncbi:MAG: hypothetical protein QUS35_13515 [bacterium]|nr:hypothetical protein [bacterium]
MKVRIALLALLIAVSPVFAQKKAAAKSTPAVSSSSTLNDVRLFQSFFEDAPIAKTDYVQPSFSYSDYDAMSVMTIGAMGGHPFSPKMDLGGELHYASYSWDMDGVDGESGITDLGLFGRYNLKSEKGQVVSVGAQLTLPIGSEDIGQGNMNFGGFGAYRKALSGGMVVTATAGLYFYEVGDDRENFLRLGGGLIKQMNKKTNLVGEFVMKTEFDYMMLSGGVDYAMSNGAKLRGGLGLGLDDGTPDMMLYAGYFMKL